MYLVTWYPKNRNCLFALECSEMNPDLLEWLTVVFSLSILVLFNRYEQRGLCVPQNKWHLLKQQLRLQAKD